MVDVTEWAYLLCGHYIKSEQVKQRICIKFCINPEHSSVETIGMIQKAAAMGSWCLAASSRQCAYSCITSHAEYFGNTSNHPGDSGSQQPRFGALQLLAFPKTKITFEREEISDCWWDSGNYDGAADSDWENCVRSQGTYFEGDWDVIVLCTVSCILYLLQKCLYFSYFMVRYHLDRPRMFNLKKMKVCFQSGCSILHSHHVWEL